MKILLCLVLLVPAAHCFQKEDRQEITKTLKFGTTTDRRLLIDNMAGSITVEGYDGQDVQLSAVRLTKAESDERLKESFEDVTLDIQEHNDRIEVVVEVPWRKRWEGFDNWGYRYYGFEVSYDFTVKVPRDVAVFLRTVNEGNIRVTGMNDEFDVRNVNGSITMKEMKGSGRASTVNGSVEVSFDKNPAADCSFHTVNGKVRVALQDPLSADLVLKTFNGHAYTDFDFSVLPRRLGTITNRRGRTVYRGGDQYSVRVGKGGPKIAFDTLNGDINIVKQQ